MRTVLFLLLLFQGLTALSQPVNNESLCGLTAKDMLPLRLDVKQNILQLKKEGRIQFKKEDRDLSDAQRLLTPNAPASIRFQWPLRPKNAEEFTYFQIGNYTDLQPTGTNCILDYMGGVRTYDGHQGIDIGVGPYYWQRKKDGDVYVVAAAGGIIVSRHDGEFDGNCSLDTWIGPSGRGNHVAILHADDSTVTYYMHMKNGSVTNKQVGDYVLTGDILGAVASSGRSTGPHLHFQVNTGWQSEDSTGNFIEPFAGPENYTTPVSLWADQKPYKNPDIYGMETHGFSAPDWYNGFCDSVVNLNSLRSNFSPGSWVMFRSHVLDWDENSGPVSHGLISPALTTVTSTTMAQNLCTVSRRRCSGDNPVVECPHVIVSGDYQLPTDAPSGTWIYWINHNGKIYHRYFTVNCQPTEVLSGAHIGRRGYLVSNRITSTATIAGNANWQITYGADTEVVLSPGFEATAGCTFTASTRGCNNAQSQ